MKIIVNTEEEKRRLIEESEYIHDFAFTKDDVDSLDDEHKNEEGWWSIGLDSDKAGGLMHLYYRPDIIEVKYGVDEYNEGIDLLCKDIKQDKLSFDEAHNRFKELHNLLPSNIMIHSYNLDRAMKRYKNDPNYEKYCKVYSIPAIREENPSFWAKLLGAFKNRRI